MLDERYCMVNPPVMVDGEPVRTEVTGEDRCSKHTDLMRVFLPLDQHVTVQADE